MPVAQAAGDLPFYLYDIPVMTDVCLPMPEFLSKAKEQIPNLKGLKFTNPDLVQLQECLHLGDAGSGHGDFEILFGCDEFMLAGVMFGAPEPSAAHTTLPPVTTGRWSTLSNPVTSLPHERVSTKPFA